MSRHAYVSIFHGWTGLDSMGPGMNCIGKRKFWVAFCILVSLYTFIILGTVNNILFFFVNIVIKHFLA